MGRLGLYPLSDRHDAKRHGAKTNLPRRHPTLDDSPCVRNTVLRELPSNSEYIQIYAGRAHGWVMRPAVEIEPSTCRIGRSAPSISQPSPRQSQQQVIVVASAENELGAVRDDRQVNVLVIGAHGEDRCELLKPEGCSVARSIDRVPGGATRKRGCSYEYWASGLASRPRCGQRL